MWPDKASLNIQTHGQYQYHIIYSVGMSKELTLCVTPPKSALKSVKGPSRTRGLNCLLISKIRHHNVKPSVTGLFTKGCGRTNFKDAVTNPWSRPKPGYKMERDAIEASPLFKVLLTAKTICMYVFYFQQSWDKIKKKKEIGLARGWLEGWLVTRGWLGLAVGLRGQEVSINWRFRANLLDSLCFSPCPNA